MNESPDALSLALAEAQRIGALGPQPIAEAIEHSMAYVRLLGDCRSLIDLGSGGGLPGLVIAARCPEISRIVLIDRRAKRTDLLFRLVGQLQLRDRVFVVTDDVVTFGSRSTNRGAFEVVTARSFGTPSLVCQAAWPLLQIDGRLLVSEPPDGDGARWNTPDIARMFHVEQIADGIAVLVRNA